MKKASFTLKKPMFLLKGLPDVFDEKDQLVFMLNDAGDKLKYAENNFIELALRTEEGLRYVYLKAVEKNNHFLPKVSFDSQKGKIKSEYYSLEL